MVKVDLQDTLDDKVFTISAALITLYHTVAVLAI